MLNEANTYGIVGVLSKWPVLAGLGLVISGIVFLYARSWWWMQQYKKRTVERNCGLPFIFADKFLGITPFIRLLMAAKNFRVLQTVGMSFTMTQKRTVMTQTLGRWAIITCEPEIVKTMLATDFKSFSTGHRHGQLSPLLGDGIFTSEGETWRHSRTMLRPQFSRERISRLQSLEGHIELLLRHFKNAAATGEYIDSQMFLHRLTLDSASKFLFGVSVDTLAEGLSGEQSKMLRTKNGLKSATDVVNGMEFSLAVLSKRARAGNFYFLVDSIEFRKQVAICHDFVDQLIEETIARKTGTLEEHEKAGHDLHFIEELSYQTDDRKFMRDQAFTILLAGRDTTSALLSFCMYHLTRHPEIYSKLREVVLDNFGTEPGDHITFESLKKCKYVSCILNETLRLTPVVPLNLRMATRDTTVPVGGGPNEDQPLFVPKGTFVIWNVQHMHRLPQYWGTDADQFKPERWEDPNKFHSWDFLPFNGGPRICLGQQFALTEASYTLVRIAQTFSRLETKPELLNTELLQRTNLTTIVAGGIPTKFYM